MEKNKDQPEPVLKSDLVDNFVKITEAIQKLTSSTSKLAREGPTIMMMTYGAMMIIIALGLKLLPNVNLEIAEFCVLVASGSLLFAASAAMRMYQWKVQADIDSEIRQQAFQTLQIQQSVANKNATVGGGKTVKT